MLERRDDCCARHRWPIGGLHPFRFFASRHLKTSQQRLESLKIASSTNQSCRQIRCARFWSMPCNPHSSVAALRGRGLHSAGSVDAAQAKTKMGPCAWRDDGSQLIVRTTFTSTGALSIQYLFHPLSQPTIILDPNLFSTPNSGILASSIPCPLKRDSFSPVEA